MQSERVSSNGSSCVSEDRGNSESRDCELQLVRVAPVCCSPCVSFLLRVRSCSLPRVPPGLVDVAAGSTIEPPGAQCARPNHTRRAADKEETITRRRQHETHTAACTEHDATAPLSAPPRLQRACCPRAPSCRQRCSDHCGLRARPMVRLWGRARGALDVSRAVGGGGDAASEM